MSTHHNNPAFPQPAVDGLALDRSDSGLTKREYFAGQVMIGLCANADNFGLPEGANVTKRAQCAIALADALLSELNKPPTTT